MSRAEIMSRVDAAINQSSCFVKAKRFEDQRTHAVYWRLSRKIMVPCRSFV